MGTGMNVYLPFYRFRCAYAVEYSSLSPNRTQSFSLMFDVVCKSNNNNNHCKNENFENMDERIKQIDYPILGRMTSTSTHVESS